MDRNEDRKWGAWYGDPALKAEVLANMKRHRERDEFAQGVYANYFTQTEMLADLSAIRSYNRPLGKGALYEKFLDQDDLSQGSYTFRGCAVGCTLVDRLSFEELRDVCALDSWHRAMQREYNIPATVCAGIDHAFESCETFAEAGDFAVEIIEAIAVGADLWSILPEHLDNGPAGCEDYNESCPACTFDNPTAEEMLAFVRGVTTLHLMATPAPEPAEPDLVLVSV